MSSILVTALRVMLGILAAFSFAFAGVLVFASVRATRALERAFFVLSALGRASLAVTMIAIAIPRHRVGLIAACLSVTALVASSLLARRIPDDDGHDG